MVCYCHMVHFGIEIYGEDFIYSNNAQFLKEIQYDFFYLRKTHIIPDFQDFLHPS